MSEEKDLPEQEIESPEATLPTFASLDLSEEVTRAVADMGFEHPTPVQHAVYQVAATGRDLVVQARTGTGKTAAFGLPVVDRLIDTRRSESQYLILCPTRELALQIHREIEAIAKYKEVSCTAVYGGAPMQPQIDALKKGAQIIAGTPGRVLDHLERGTLDPSTLKGLVLDESDEMLSMGFLPQITAIMEQLPEVHQTLLFSATIPPDVKRIAETRCTDPEFITLSGDHVGALSIDHFVYHSQGQKSEEIVRLIEIENPESAIVFCNTRDQTKRIAKALKKAGYAADWLNAELSQKERESVMSKTRAGRLRFLVCTDVAARGIDISHLTHVINADFPASTENYVHRTGRTGRAGKTGTAISLITPADVGNVYMMRLIYKIFPVERTLPSPEQIRTREETDLVLKLAETLRSAPQATRSLVQRIRTSDAAEQISGAHLQEHLAQHAELPALATEARKERAPEAVEEPAPARKEKKKQAKSRKKEKAAEASSPGASDEAIPAKKKSKPKKQTESEAGEAKRRRAKEDSEPAVAPSTERTKPTSKKSRASAKKSDKMEVVSAAELLAAEGIDWDDAIEGLDDAESSSGSERSKPRGNRGGAGRAHEDQASGRRSAKRGAAPSREEPRTEASRRGKGEAKIFVNAGQDDELYEDDILDALEDGGITEDRVRFINVKQRNTFVGIDAQYLDAAVEAIDGFSVAGIELRAEEARRRRRS
ncbi:MAG: DEAD/DEAH box helicase [Polyangiaceae bacterium]|nr:DEAD/DEAH box helicase [Polyangiaceae bacterium]